MSSDLPEDNNDSSLSPERLQELDRLIEEHKEFHKKELWVEVPETGYVEIIERNIIESVILVGDYTYFSLYEFTFKDGTKVEYKLDYHNIKDSAEELKEEWAIELMKTLKPICDWAEFSWKKHQEENQEENE